MPNIKLKSPSTAYTADIDTGAMVVEIRDAYIGVKFISGDHEVLTVQMRDGGYELRYTSGFGEIAAMAPLIEMKNGHVRVVKDEPKAEIQ